MATEWLKMGYETEYQEVQPGGWCFFLICTIQSMYIKYTTHGYIDRFCPANTPNSFFLLYHRGSLSNSIPIVHADHSNLTDTATIISNTATIIIPQLLSSLFMSPFLYFWHPTADMRDDGD